MAFVDPRLPGEPLWPSKYPLTELSKRRALSGEYDWAALFQQQPIPSGGGLFKEIWFAGKFVDVPPATMRVARGWDTAGTEDGGDYTCGVKIGEEVLTDEYGNSTATGRFFILDVKRDRLGPDGVDQLIRVTAELDGVECSQREEKEGGSAGVAVIAARAKTLKGYDYAEVVVTGSKVTRSRPFRAQCEAGNVYILRDRGIGGFGNTGWNKAYVDELCGFPTAKYDDQVDASSCSFNAVLLEPIPEKRELTW